MIKCPECGSENIYFSKKRNIQVCEDCSHTFTIEKEFVSQRIFLSYGHDKNELIVNLIKEDLEKRGHSVWIDKSEIKSGQDWREKIYKGIKESNQFLAFLSKYSTRTPGVCLDEIAIAVGISGCSIKTILLEKDIQAPVSISNIQWLDMSDWEQYYALGGMEWDKWYGDNLKEIARIVENEENQVFSGEITYLEHQLHPTSFETKLRLLLQNDFYGRKWLIDKVEKWYKDEHESRLFWLMGGPGVGKSAFIARLAHYFSSIAAMQFCEWDKKDSSHPKQIIKTIAFQLATKLNDYRKAVLELINKEDLESMSPENLFDYLLVDPLNSLIDGGRERQIILIDAIDELSGYSNHIFVQLLSRSINKFPNWIGFIVTSRPESAVMNPLRAFRPVTLEVDNAENKNDINEFLINTLKTKFSDESTVQEISNIIYQKSAGIFLYAKEVVSAIMADNISMTELEHLPPGMAGFYWHTFERIFNDYNYYSSVVRPFLKIIIATKESLSLDIIKNLLDTTKEGLNEICIRLQSFFPVVMENGVNVIKPYHKSINEWLTSTNSGKYFIDVMSGHGTIANYGLNLFKKSDKSIPLYFVKHLMDHLKDTNMWYGLSYSEQEKILEQLISQSKSYGYKYLEYYYITKLEELIEINDKAKVLSYKLNYYSRTSGDEIINIAGQLLNEINNVTDEDVRFNYLNDIAVAYFYIGLNQKGIDILSDVEKTISEKYPHDIEKIANLNHTFGLLMHDLDKNEIVVKRSVTANKAFRQLDKKYEDMITRVNIFDGLMGVGKLKEADKIALSIFNDNDKMNLIHVSDILDLCYANLLLTQGKLMAAFEHYERGLAIAETIEHEWDFIYGRIWREFCLSKIGDLSSIDNLKRLRELTRKRKYKYLEALASAFCLIATHLLSIRLDNKEVQKMFEFISKAQTPGLLAQALAVIILDNYTIKIKAKDLTELLLDTVLDCEGVKGAPEIFAEFIDKHDVTAYDKGNRLKEWINIYIHPIIAYREELEQKMFSKYDVLPKLKSFRCRDCEAHCCYDGVYLNEKDEEMIHYAVKNFPQYFKHLPEDYIIDGNWRNLMHGRKTNISDYQYKINTYPKHFTNTRCVFAYENGECSLQRAATNNLLHPWKFKPQSCWLFPIKSRGNNTIEPPLIGNDDPLNMGEEYPGYISFLPCGHPTDTGTEWYKIYKNELHYFEYIQTKKNLIKSGI